MASTGTNRTNPGFNVGEKVMINFEMNYSHECKTWSMLASVGDVGYGTGWIDAKPTQKMIRKFKQTAHKSLNPYAVK